jgi:hypothetical protein
MAKREPLDPEKVKALAAGGATDAEIAAYFERPVASITGRFRKQLKAGRARRRISIRQAQNKAALVKGNATLLTWLGKNELGQTERPVADYPPEPRLGPKVG